jgi:hypothetical protein
MEGIFNKQDLIELIEIIGKENVSLIVTVVLLPTGAREVITNYEKLQEKIDYLLNAYDDNLQLKACSDIKLLDFIIM